MKRTNRIPALLIVVMLVFLAASCADGEAAAADITVYGSHECSLCTELRAQLDARDVPYNFVDLAGNESGMIELSKKLAKASWYAGAIEIPIVEVDGQLLRRPSVGEILRRTEG